MTAYYIEQGELRYAIDNYICQSCGKPAKQLAHRIINSKDNLRRYGEKVVNNNANLVPVCGLDCNVKYALGISKAMQTSRLVELIQLRNSDMTTKQINYFIKFK